MKLWPSNSWKVLCESHPFLSSSDHFQESFFHGDRPYWHYICTSYQSKSHLPTDKLPYPHPTQFQVCQAWLVPRNPHGWIRETMRFMPLLMRTVGPVSVRVKRKNAKGSCYKMEDLGLHSLHVNSPNNWQNNPHGEAPITHGCGSLRQRWACYSNLAHFYFLSFCLQPSCA